MPVRPYSIRNPATFDFLRKIALGEDKEEQGEADINMTSGVFLERIHSNPFPSQDDLLDFIYDEMDRLCWRGEEGFAIIDEILDGVDLVYLSTAAMRSLLTTTYPAKDRLASRPEFFRRVKSTMYRIRGSEATERILRWLE